jgi:hypothetical protein
VWKKEKNEVGGKRRKKRADKSNRYLLSSQEEAAVHTRVLGFKQSLALLLQTFPDVAVLLSVTTSRIVDHHSHQASSPSPSSAATVEWARGP